MPRRLQFAHVTARMRARGAALLLAGGVLLSGGCTGYQLVLATPTATPGPLGVRQITGPTVIDAGPANSQAASNAPVVSAPAAAGAAITGQAAPAAANPSTSPAQSTANAAIDPLSAPPITARATTTGGSSSPPQSTGAPAINAAPAPSATTRPTTTGASATPMPSYTATPSPSPSPTTRPASPTATPSPTPSPTPDRPALVQIYLPQGTSDFLYVGPTLPADKALAALAGQYDIIYFTPPGATQQVAYRPGIDIPPTLPTRTLVRIGMKRPMSFTMYP